MSGPARVGATSDDERTSVTTEPTSTPTEVATSEATAWGHKARASLKRYRVMAWITGVMLLVLCVEMILKYVLQLPGFNVEGDPRNDAARIIAMVHGWVYVVYLVTAFDLWSKLRWRTLPWWHRCCCWPRRSTGRSAALRPRRSGWHRTPCTKRWP